MPNIYKCYYQLPPLLYLPVTTQLVVGSSTSADSRPIIPLSFGGESFRIGQKTGQPPDLLS